MKLELIKETKATGEVFYYVVQDGRCQIHTMSSNYESTYGCFERLKNQHENKIETLKTYETH